MTDDDKARVHVADTLAAECARYTTLLVTDHEALLQRAAEMGGAVHVVHWADAAQSPANDDWLMLSLAEAGKKCLIWCTPTDDGRRIAREAGRTLKPAGAVVMHITAVAPDQWRPLVHPFEDLASSARTTLPPAPNRHSNGSNGVAADRLSAFDTSPAELARRVIVTYGAELLVVDDGDYGTGYALDATNGLWRSGGDTWARWLVEIADAMTFDAATSGLTGRALTTAIGHVNRLKRPGMVDQVRPMLRAMLRYLRDRGERCSAVTECKAQEMDADTRYIAAGNGVVDLHRGALLAPSEGRRHLVTMQVPVAFDPDAADPAVDRLFGHLGPEGARWWWRVLGFHLLGAPSRRFYVAVGPPSGGKSTLANALCGTLGPYAARPADDALEARPGGSAGLSPELEAFTLPRRWAVIDEAPRMKIAAPLLKRLSGDAETTYRRLHEQLRTVPVTGTVLLICNPGSVPRLRLQDEAMADRLRELPYAAVPTPDPGFKDRVQTDTFRRAFLARLVAAAAAETPRVPPEAPTLVINATAERIREDVGELGAFARRVQRGADVLTVAKLWQAWCRHNDEFGDVAEAGGVSKRRLSGALRDHVPGLPAPTPFSHLGDKVRGWRGWELLDEVPEAAAPLPSGAVAGTVPMLDGTLYRLDDEDVGGEELLRRLRAQGAGWRLHVENGIATIDQVFTVDQETLPLPGMNAADREIW